MNERRISDINAKARKDTGIVFVVIEFHAEGDFDPGKTMRVSIGHMRWQVALTELKSHDYTRRFFKTSPLALPFPLYKVLVLTHDYFQMVFESEDYSETGWVEFFDLQIGFTNVKRIWSNSNIEEDI